jgi:translation initiation factor IF-1
MRERSVRGQEAYRWESLSLHATTVLTFPLVALVALTLGCARGASEKAEAGGAAAPNASAEAGRPATIVSARIMPDPVLLSRPVSVEIQAEESDDRPLAFRYQWFVNGVPEGGQTGPMLDPGTLRRGDHVSVEVVPVSGETAGVAVRAPEAVVANSPPVMRSVRMEPTTAHRGDRLRVQVEASDPDHDPIVYKYRWFRNQRLERETEEAELATDDLSRGDTIAVEVIPWDGAVHGRSLASEPLTLGNSPPKITSRPPLTTEPERYQYTVLAADPDGDFLNFTLEQGPAGMTMDRTTGRLTWPHPEQARGPQRVRILVDDGHRGEAFQEFEIAVTLASASPVTHDR